MARYATKAEVAAFSEEFAALDDSFQDPLIDAASRQLDRLCEVAENFFAPAEGSTSAKDFYGDNTAFLLLDPYDPATTPTIVMESGYTEPTWIERGEVGRQYLVVNEELKDQSVLSPTPNADRFVGWPDRVKVTVTADWGFPTASPDMVRHATIELAIHNWRKADPAREALEGGTPGIFNREVPPTVEGIVMELKSKFSRTVLFA